MVWWLILWYEEHLFPGFPLSLRRTLSAMLVMNFIASLVVLGVTL